MRTARLAVTGATGHLGGAVARKLAARGIPQRLVVRDAARAPQLPGAEVAVASYDDTTALRDALAGIETVLFVSGHEGPQRLEQHRSAIDAFATSDVQRVVYTSFLSAAPEASFTFARDHAATEEMLRGSGLGFTFLRPSFYLDSVAAWADPAGVIRGPARDGRIAWVSREDLADVAVAALLSDATLGQTLDVTGPDLLTLEATAAGLSASTGRPYRFENESLEEAYASRRAAYPEAEAWELDGWVGTYVAIANGEMAVVSDTVERLTGHAPASLADVYRR